jgi:hypothetical protein
MIMQEAQEMTRGVEMKTFATVRSALISCFSVLIGQEVGTG